MRFPCSRWFPRFFLTASFLTVGAALAARGDAPATNHPLRIVLVGDSTVTDKAGWGLGFKQFLDTNKTELINAARGGRSSMSFRKEGRWTNALALKGDYYLIQFGHNNEPGKPGRSTDMPMYVSNMVSYVEEARAIGVKPVLVTSLARRQWDPANPGKIKSSLAPYAEEVRKIAAEKQVPLVDLQARSIELYESLGREKCLEFSPIKTVNGTNTFDGTHLKVNGRVMIARLVVEELRRAVPELAPMLRAEPADPNPVAKEDSFDAIVSADGSGTHTNVQGAIAAAPTNAVKPFVILIKSGIYPGPIIVPREKRNLRFVGEELTNTILAYAFNVNEPPPGETYPFNPGVVIAGDDFSAERITFQNTSGDHGQALALRVDGDRAIFKDCRILGWQDTLMINNGRDYFTNCYIAGRVDFIYGSATAVFDHCEIHSRNGGHITAASTPPDHSYGFVFLNCRLTGDPSPWLSPAGIPVNTNKNGKLPQADLGRPWRPYASVTYLNCEMGGHIKPEGWDNWRNPTNELTARYSEYKNTGPGANPAARVKWSKQLTGAEAAACTVENILRGSDGWNPAAQP